MNQDACSFLSMLLSVMTLTNALWTCAMQLQPTRILASIVLTMQKLFPRKCVPKRFHAQPYLATQTNATTNQSFAQLQICALRTSATNLLTNVNLVTLLSTNTILVEFVTEMASLARKSLFTFQDLLLEQLVLQLF